MAWEDDLGMDAIRKRLLGQTDARGRVGINSRGANVYNGGSNAAVTGRMNAGWGLNPRFAGQARDILAKRSGIGSNEEYQHRRLGEAYNTRLDDSERVRDLALKQNTERMSNQGLLRSGINVAEEGKIGDVYQREVDDASSWRARSLEDVARQILGSYQGVENEWSGLEEENTRWEAEQARLRAEEEARRIAAEQALEAQRRAIEAEVARAQPRPSAAGQYRPAAVSSGGGGGGSTGSGGGTVRSSGGGGSSAPAAKRYVAPAPPTPKKRVYKQPVVGRNTTQMVPSSRQPSGRISEF